MAELALWRGGVGLGGLRRGDVAGRGHCLEGGRNRPAMGARQHGCARFPGNGHEKR